MYIYKAILKHGHSNFSIVIQLIYVKREQYYIDLLKPKYNIFKTAGSRFGVNHTHVSNLKNRLSQSKRVKIEVTDLELNTYNSIREAAKAIVAIIRLLLSFFNMNKLLLILVDIF